MFEMSEKYFKKMVPFILDIILIFVFWTFLSTCIPVASYSDTVWCSITQRLHTLSSWVKKRNSLNHFHRNLLRRNLSMYLPIIICMYTGRYPFVGLSVFCLSACLAVCRSQSLSICLSVCLSIYLPTYNSVSYVDVLSNRVFTVRCTRPLKMFQKGLKAID